MVNTLLGKIESLIWYLQFGSKSLVKKVEHTLLGNDRWTNETFFPNFVQEVERDISLLKTLRDALDYGDISEPAKNPLYNYLTKKYQEYCPSKIYRFFSEPNQLRYLNLRVRIDDLLGEINSTESQRNV